MDGGGGGGGGGFHATEALLWLIRKFFRHSVFFWNTLAKILARELLKVQPVQLTL